MATKSKKSSTKKVNAAATKQATSSVKRIVLKPMNHRPGSKAAKAHAFIAANPKLGRGEAIKALKTRFKLTDNTAAHWTHVFRARGIAPAVKKDD